MVIDCYHNDLTDIIRMRGVRQRDRKRRNLARYKRRYARIGATR